MSFPIHLIRPNRDQVIIFLSGLFIISVAWLISHLAEKCFRKTGQHFRKKVLLGLKIFVFLVLILQILSVLGRHHHFLTFSFDLGIFDQAVWSLSKFHVAYDTVRDLPSLFGDHLEFTLVLFAPLYWLFDRAETLLITQVAAIFISGWYIKAYVFKKTDDEIAGYMLFLAWVLSWQVSAALLFDFHPLVIGACFLIVGLLKIEEGSLWGIAFLILALLSRETIAVYLTFIGLAISLNKRHRNLGISMMLLSPVYLYIGIKYLVPFLIDRPYPYLGLYYGGSSTTFIEQIQSLLIPQKAILWTYFWLPAVFCIKYLTAWIVLLPAWGERFLSVRPDHWLPLNHYNMIPLALTFWVLISRLNAKNIFIYSLTAFLIAIPSGIILHRENYMLFSWHQFSPFSLNSHEKEIYKIMSAIPKDSSVVSHTVLIPHLSARKTIIDVATYHGGIDNINSIEELSPDYVLVDSNYQIDMSPFPPDRAENFIKEMKKSKKYQISESLDTIYLFKRVE